MTRRKKSFTLLEMLIVVGIIGILATIAVPNFLSAQNRAKISKAKVNIRILVEASDCYHVDWNRFPPTVQRLPEDPYGILSDVQLRVLTTPVQYTSIAAFKDPFGRIRGYSFQDLLSGSGVRWDFPLPDPDHSIPEMTIHHQTKPAGKPTGGFLLACASSLSGPQQSSLPRPMHSHREAPDDGVRACLRTVAS